MIEAYAFLVAFAFQVVAGSVLMPLWIIRHVREWVANYGSERFTALYPDVEYQGHVARFTRWYRAANGLIALLGIGMLTWLFDRVRLPDWPGDVNTPTTLYFMLQMSPLMLLSIYAVARYWRMIVHPTQEPKRTATLKRRGLFDFVSPVAFWFAVLSYPLFVAVAIYLDREVYGNASLSRPCIISIAAVSLVYLMNATVVFKYLYGRKNPLVTQEGRVHTIGVRVKSSVLSCIAVAWFVMVNGVLGLPHLLEWRPFALSSFFALTSLLTFMDWRAPSRPPEQNGTGAAGVGAG